MRECLAIVVSQRLRAEDVVAASESLNGSLRDECLSANWFESIEEAKATIEAWRVGYNESRPHQALGHLTPREFSLKAQEFDESRRPQQAGN
jgi:transposase InsO family protein